MTLRMASVSLVLDGDHCWPDLTVEHVTLGKDAKLAMAFLSNATVSGKAAVTLRIDLPNGQVALASVTLALLRSAVAAFEAREQYLTEQAELAKKGGLP